MSMALIRYRKGGFVHLDSDDEGDESSGSIYAERQYY
jgi:hypothetical protein